MNKTYQLRVRVEGELHRQLVKRVEAGEGTSSLSILVRDALEAYVNPDGPSHRESLLSVSRQTHEQLAQLAKQLDRRECHVLEDCVQGIIDNIEEDKVPLIVQEVRLRREFFGLNSSKSA